MNLPLPRWCVPIIAAKRLAWNNLPTSEQEAARAAMAEARTQSAERRQTRLAYAKLIFALHNDGKTIDEIAATVGRRPDSVRDFAASRGVLISRSLAHVRRAITLAILHERGLRRMASDYGKTPAETLNELLALWLADDCATARRWLRIKRRSAA